MVKYSDVIKMVPDVETIFHDAFDVPDWHTGDLYVPMSDFNWVDPGWNKDRILEEEHRQTAYYKWAQRKKGCDTDLWTVCWQSPTGKTGRSGPQSKSLALAAIDLGNKEFPRINHWMVRS